MMQPMEIITDKALLERIEEFLTQHHMKPSRFGLAAMGDGALVFQLREGRSLSLRNAEKVVAFMANYRPTPEKAA